MCVCVCVFIVRFEILLLENGCESENAIILVPAHVEISMNLYFVIELVALFLVRLFELNASIFIVLS